MPCLQYSVLELDPFHKYHVIRILVVSNADRCGSDCVHFSRCQHFINQVGLNHKDTKNVILMMMIYARNPNFTRCC